MGSATGVGVGVVGMATGGSGVVTVLPSSLPPPQAVNAAKAVNAATARKRAEAAATAPDCSKGVPALNNSWAAEADAPPPSRMATDL